MLGWVSTKRHTTLLEGEKEECRDERGKQWGWGVGGKQEKKAIRGEFGGEAWYMGKDGECVAH